MNKLGCKAHLQRVGAQGPIFYNENNSKWHLGETACAEHKVQWLVIVNIFCSQWVHLTQFEHNELLSCACQNHWQWEKRPVCSIRADWADRSQILLVKQTRRYHTQSAIKKKVIEMNIADYLMMLTCNMHLNIDPIKQHQILIKQQIKFLRNRSDHNLWQDLKIINRVTRCIWLTLAYDTELNMISFILSWAFKMCQMHLSNCKKRNWLIFSDTKQHARFEHECQKESKWYYLTKMIAKNKIVATTLSNFSECSLW